MIWMERNKREMKIINYGSMNLDYVYQVPYFVQPGETMSTEAFSVNCGGKGLNQSIALSRAGARVWHAGALGTSDGDILRDALRKDQVNTDLVLNIDGISTGHAVIQVDHAGQNSIILYGGANRNIPPHHIDAVMDLFEEGDYLILQNEVNGNKEIMERAHKKGATIILNPSPMNESIFSLPLNYVDWFMVNEIEAKALCGGFGTQLSQKYPNSGVVLTMGKRGVQCFCNGEVFTHGTYGVPVVDTTAAGDTFCGYFVALIAQGKNINDALQLASLASSIAVSRHGAQASIPFLHELNDFAALDYLPYYE